MSSVQSPCWLMIRLLIVCSVIPYYSNILGMITIQMYSSWGHLCAKCQRENPCVCTAPLLRCEAPGQDRVPQPRSCRIDYIYIASAKLNWDEHNTYAMYIYIIYVYIYTHTHSLSLAISKAIYIYSNIDIVYTVYVYSLYSVYIYV
jgi:hypothetical protein